MRCHSFLDAGPSRNEGFEQIWHVGDGEENEGGAEYETAFVVRSAAPSAHYKLGPESDFTLNIPFHDSGAITE